MHHFFGDLFPKVARVRSQKDDIGAFKFSLPKANPKLKSKSCSYNPFGDMITETLKKLNIMQWNYDKHFAIEQIGAQF